MAEEKPFDQPVCWITIGRHGGPFLLDAAATGTPNGYDNPAHRTLRIYDTLGRVVSTVDPNAGQMTATFDDAGNVRDSLDHGRNLTRSYRYDALDRITQIIPPAGEETVNFTYIASGGAPLVQTSIILTPSVEKRFHYDSLGQLSRLDRTIAGTFLTTSYENDLLGRVVRTSYPIKVNNVRTVIQYEYVGDSLKRVCDVVATESCSSALNQYVVDATYSDVGQLTAISLPGGIRTFEYDSATQRETRDRFEAGSNSDYYVEFKYKSPSGAPHYDPIGNLLQVDGTSYEPTGAQVHFGGTYSYDNRNRLVSWQRTNQSALSYQYDSLGNLTNLEGRTQQYSATKPHQLELVNGTIPYGYDASGNVTSFKRYNGGPTTHLTYDSANRLKCAGTYGAGSCETLSVLYAGDDERVKHQDSTGYSYYHAGPDFKYMTKPSAALKQSWIEVYAFGERIATKQINMGSLVPASGEPFSIPVFWWPVVAGGIVLLSIAVFDPRRAPMAVARRPVAASLVLVISAQMMMPRVAFAGGGGGGGGAVPEEAIFRWIISDQVGSGLVEIDNAGHRVSHTVFSPFGNVVQLKGTQSGRTIFGGHEVESTTGLVYMNARWYDPVSGRFMSVDPVLDMRTPQAQNAYSYVANNPVNLIDPTGASSESGSNSIWVNYFNILTGEFSHTGQINNPAPGAESASYFTTAAPAGVASSGGGSGGGGGVSAGGVSVGGAGAPGALPSGTSPQAGSGGGGAVPSAPTPGGSSSQYDCGPTVTCSQDYPGMSPNVPDPIDIVIVLAAFGTGALARVLHQLSRDALRNAARAAARAAANSVDDILRPGGQLIGRAGSSSRIRQIEGGLDEAQSLFGRLSQGGKVIDNTSYPGTLVQLPRGTVGIRPVSGSGPPTIDVNIPGIGIKEIKFLAPTP